MYQASQTYSIKYSRLEYLASAVQYTNSTESSIHPAYVPFQSQGKARPVYIPDPPSVAYALGKQEYHLFQTHQEYHFQPESFLKPGREGKFVGKAEEVREFVEETFERMFDQPFPLTLKSASWMKLPLGR